VEHLQTCLIVLTLGLVSVDSAAKDNPLFQDDSILKAVLTAPITQTYAQKKQNVRIYFPGQWTYSENDGPKQRLEVSIRTRGIYRRQYCRLPPLRLNFKKSQVKGTLFASQDKLKLVSPCSAGPGRQQYIVLEYLAYRVFQIMTEYSFRTRLVRLSYVDSDGKKVPWTDLTFVIEGDADMARRLGMERLRVKSSKFHEMDQAKTALVELFHLLIANNDYSVLQGPPGGQCCHNTEVIAIMGKGGGRIPIPYDFDLSGLVNAAYALPPRRLPITSVRSRYYKGLCQPPEILADAIEHVQSKRDEIMALFMNSKELDEKHKEKALKFIEDYYAILDSPKRLDREIISRCRGKDHLDAMQ
jgi:hypothetical protein